MGVVVVVVVVVTEGKRSIHGTEILEIYFVSAVLAILSACSFAGIPA